MGNVGMGKANRWESFPTPAAVYLILSLNLINFSLAYMHASTFIEEIKEGLTSCDFDNCVKKRTSFNRLNTFLYQYKSVEKEFRIYNYLKRN